MVISTNRYTIPLRQVGLADIARVGGKNASLGELLGSLSSQGVRVPPGFAITAEAFDEHLAQNGLSRTVHPLLDRLDVSDLAALARAGERIRASIRSSPLPKSIEKELLRAYRELSESAGESETDVAVRSSATAEDLPTASFAGQQETYLNVRGEAQLMSAVRDCMASLFTDRAIVYRAERGFSHRSVALSVGVQKMVRSDTGSAGVIFTLDTESGFRDVVLITGSWGLGETVVQGRVDPDEFWVHKPTLAQGYRSILRRERGDKALELVHGDGDQQRVRERPVPAERRGQLVLSDTEVLELARSALQIEEHYSRRAGRWVPMDIEWAKDGETGLLYIVQARPETVHSQLATPAFELFRKTGSGKVIALGKSVGTRVASGKARIIRSAGELGQFQAGEVLVAPMTDPDWEPVMKRASAIVTDHGGRTCHAAIISRELGVPCVVATKDGTAQIAPDQLITVSCAEGEEGKVYEGNVAFDREVLDPEALPEPALPVLLNVGDPDTAFFAAQLPSSGVGLARLEFIISSSIGIHPMALLYPERIRDPDTLREIARRTSGFELPRDFFVERLASGVGTIAGAFYPRPVIVRMSDFKTNEYAGLLGGKDFEPIEHNPMIGWRGASRYYDERYREGFALECEAIRHVRNVMGMGNVKIMIPFCRTLKEADLVLAELGKNGLARGRDGLEVYVMCEIPSNVILADQFSERFDGFSIGSNDLTQLTLGVDRDSELLSHVFDEHDPAIVALIRKVVAHAHARGRKVGLCGQAPSDSPEFARLLAEIGLDSVSVTSDALPRVIRALAAPRARAPLKSPWEAVIAAQVP
jgi:pyruvate,water dikinase